MWQILDSSRAMVRVTGKGGKQRIVPVGEIALEAIKKNMALRKEIFTEKAGRDDPLFVGSKNKRIDRRQVQRLVAEACRRAEISDHDKSSRTEAQFRNPYTRQWRRTACYQGNARSFEPFDNTKIYAYKRRASERSLSSGPPAQWQITSSRNIN